MIQSAVRERRLVFIIPVMIMIMAALACGSSTPEPTATPVPTSTPEPTAVPVAMASLDVENLSSETICFLYISSVEKTEWDAADQRLGSSEVIGPNETKTFTVAVGTYDLRAEDCFNEELASRSNAKFLEGDALVWTLSDTVEEPAATTSLFVVNDSSLELCELYVVSAGSANWGNNQLAADQTITSGGTSFELWGVVPGFYDLRVVACGSTISAEQLNVDLNADFTWTIYD